MAELLNIELDGRPVVSDTISEPEIPVVRGQKVYIETYGCQMNVSDTELMMGILKRAGYQSSSRPEDADVVLLNTCAIREHAEERVVGRLNQLSYLKVKKPHLVMGVSGCMAKHLADEFMHRVPSVDLVLGPDSYRRLPDLIAEASREPALDVRLDRDEDYLGLDPLRKNGTHAWITIMRGCDKFCTFCIVPYVRGRERSVSAPEIVRQAEVAASEGFQEVTLLGQTVNSYRHGDCDFADLLQMVAGVDGIRRIRFTSPHPSDFTDKLIDTMAGEEKICRFVHLPVQSGSDSVLGAMKRNYTVSEYLNLVDRLRSTMQGLCLSTDVIAGFSGETEADFEATLDLMRQVRYDSAFMFKYSPREGTVAHREIADTVSEVEKGRRLEAVIALQNQISEEINRTYVGKKLDILVQGDAKKGKGLAVGKSDGFKTVVFPRSGIKDNTFVQVEIQKTTLKTLTGHPVLSQVASC
ncbi:MAG: tRNA (N6-isopentenyl adenosine(37)-C2)-methylthiotransferase MiaB [bacterium]|nr:tRNA (N6-isopentenyl adenosine(37)-C2)-methylthiotransferase MiaB [bacterium]